MADQQPIVVVIDDEWFRAGVGPTPRSRLLGPIIRQYAFLKVFDYFTRPSQSRGEIAEGLTLASIEDSNPSLIILDLGIQEAAEWRDGIEVLRCLRSSSKLRKIPVLIVSRLVHGTDSSDALSMELGALDVPEELRFEWGRLVQSNEARKSFEQALKSILQQRSPT